MGVGLGFCVIAVAGKGGVKFYRSVMSGNAFKQTDMVLGAYYQGRFESKMTKREASLILGINASAEEDQINKAHRKLMFLNHPDSGGSTYLASKVNEAKEMLIKK